MKSHFIIILVLSLFLPFSLQATELDGPSQEALVKTQMLLTNPEQRKEAIQKDAKAQKADKMVDQLSSQPATKEDIYGLASDIFADLVKETNGDAQKMQQILNEVSRNPAAFGSRWTPEQRARLKSIADQMNPKQNAK